MRTSVDTNLVLGTVGEFSRAVVVGIVADGFIKSAVFPGQIGVFGPLWIVAREHSLTATDIAIAGATATVGIDNIFTVGIVIVRVSVIVIVSVSSYEVLATGVMDVFNTLIATWNSVSFCRDEMLAVLK